MEVNQWERLCSIYACMYVNKPEVCPNIEEISDDTRLNSMIPEGKWRSHSRRCWPTFELFRDLSLVIISEIQTGDFNKIKYHKPSILEYNRYHSLNL
jgi:hypothetical protein